MSNHKIFVTAIGTDIGKTIASAVLCRALSADYWKPIQSGLDDGSDSQKVGKLAGSAIVIHPSRYILTQPLSPHAAAAIDKVKIRLSDFVLPDTKGRSLVVEGAGGLLVPINDHQLMIDLIKKLGLTPLLVVKHYLGSINHTLLSLSLLKNSGYHQLAIIYNGEKVKSSEDAISNFSKREKIKLSMLGRIPYLGKMPSQAIVAKAAKRLSL
jgi:dethiobiotin synthetase